MMAHFIHLNMLPRKWLTKLKVSGIIKDLENIANPLHFANRKTKNRGTNPHVKCFVTENDNGRIHHQWETQALDPAKKKYTSSNIHYLVASLPTTSAVQKTFKLSEQR